MYTFVVLADIDINDKQLLARLLAAPGDGSSSASSAPAVGGGSSTGGGAPGFGGGAQRC